MQYALMHTVRIATNGSELYGSERQKTRIRTPEDNERIRTPEDTLWEATILAWPRLFALLVG